MALFDVGGRHYHILSLENATLPHISLESITGACSCVISILIFSGGRRLKCPLYLPVPMVPSVIDRSRGYRSCYCWDVGKVWFAECAGGD